MRLTTPEITQESVLGMKLGNLANVNPDLAAVPVEDGDLAGIDFTNGNVIAIIIGRVAQRWGKGDAAETTTTYDNSQWERSDIEV